MDVGSKQLIGQEADFCRSLVEKARCTHVSQQGITVIAAVAILVIDFGHKALMFKPDTVIIVKL